MGDEVRTHNVNRTYTLGATSIAIFTFMLIFLYPKFASGEINALLFQATLVVACMATFSFVFASLYYYGSTLGSRIDDADRALYFRRADRFWLLGYTLLLHQVLLNPQDDRDFLGIDTWDTAEHAQAFAGSPQIQDFFSKLFEGQPEIKVFVDSGWNQW